MIRTLLYSFLQGLPNITQYYIYIFKLLYTKIQGIYLFLVMSIFLHSHVVVVTIFPRNSLFDTAQRGVLVVLNSNDSIREANEKKNATCVCVCVRARARARVCVCVCAFPWLRSTSQVRHFVMRLSRLSITRGRCEQPSFIAVDVNITCSLAIDRVHDSGVSHTSPNPPGNFIRNVSIPFFLLTLLEILPKESCV